MLAAVEDALRISRILQNIGYLKYFIKEDIARTRKMGISNLPTMCINGEQVYISIIPSKQELLDQIKKRVK